MLFLSIRPQFVASIALGTKTVELRRQVPRCLIGEWIAIYSTSPLMRLEGVAKTGVIVVSSPELVWQRFNNSCAVSKETFNDYFSGAKQAVGIELIEYRPLEQPIALNDLRERWAGFCPPQGFRYLTTKQLDAAPEITRAASSTRRKAA